MVKTLSSNWIISADDRAKINQILTIKKVIKVSKTSKTKMHPIVLGALLRDNTCPQNFGIVRNLKK